MQFSMKDKEKVDNFINEKKMTKRKDRIILSIETRKEIEELQQMLRQNENIIIQTR